MAIGLQTFIEEFALPLHAGGIVRVRAPLAVADRERWRGQAHALAQPQLAQARLARAHRLLADPPLGDCDLYDLSLWMGLHNLLFFDHPDVDRVWGRNARWRGLEGETRRLLDWARPLELWDALARHLALDGLLGLERQDTLVQTSEGVLRFAGRAPPARLGWWVNVRGLPKIERVTWAKQPHAPAVARLFGVALASSPITPMVYPEHAPGSWQPATGAGFLRVRGLARAIVHRWSRSSDWIALGARVMSGLFAGLGLGSPRAPGPSPELGGGRGPGPASRDPSGLAMLPRAEPAATAALPLSGADLGQVVAALVHLQVVAVTQGTARLTGATVSREDASAAFLGLALLVDELAPAIGSPFAGLDDARVLRRWEKWCEHVSGLVPARITEEQLSPLVAKIVQRAP